MRRVLKERRHCLRHRRFVTSEERFLSRPEDVIRVAEDLAKATLDLSTGETATGRVLFGRDALDRVHDGLNVATELLVVL
jgi:hypothetical protein